MHYLAIGEWVTSNVLFSLAFLVAFVGILGVAFYVVRGDRLNRAAMDQALDAADVPATVHEGH